MEYKYKIIDDNFKYHDGTYITRKEVIVLDHAIPSGFAFNGVTGWITTNNMLKPSLLHDYLLLTHYSRDYADQKFMEAMKVNGIHWIKRSVFYMAVCLNTDIKRWFK